ncbi:MAG: hypothetical protein ABI234_05005 [Ktedonobacteraceae bacterium]
MLETILGCEREEGGNHTKYVLRVNGRVVALTFYSRSWRESTQIDSTILSQQSKQMKCSNALWKKLLARQASRVDYFQELLRYGHISDEEYTLLCK